jgi:hypothetical protein
MPQDRINRILHKELAEKGGCINKVPMIFVKSGFLCHLAISEAEADVYSLGLVLLPIFGNADFKH